MASDDSNHLSAQLTDSSGRFARSGLQARPDDPATFLLHAATALEQLAKAVLAARHSSLIVAGNDFESLLHASGEGAFAKPRARMRTITAGEAIIRAGRFVPSVVPLVPNLEFLVAVRNGVAHLGEASASDADEVLIPYLKASEEFRAALGSDRSSYWGEFVDLVDSALKENVKQARIRVETALAIARKEFERRFGDLDDKTKEAMLQVIESGYAPEKYDEQLLDCPACNTPALVSGTTKPEMDEDWDHREGILLSVHLSSVTFIPQYLRCSACGLELRDRDELDAAGIEEPWELEDVDERDFFGADGDW